MSPVPRGARLVLVGVLVALAPAAFGGSAIAADVNADHLTNVPTAQPKQRGRVVPNKLSRELAEIPQASGADLLEGANPGVAPAFFGYSLYSDPDNPLVAIPPSTAEAHKTEPDKNTYLVLGGQRGADPAFDYGSHFVFQGHESGTPGYITRVNLDADRDHRVTLMATTDNNGANLPAFDGSTWDPFTRTLLFTAEINSPGGGVWEKSLTVGEPATDLRGILGASAYEGVQADSDGNIWLVEDNGGTTVGHARQPNSFVYRFVPSDTSDLSAGGKLQVLQVESLANPGEPIVFHAGQAAADIASQDTIDLHTYGHTFDTTWVTLHDTDTDGTDPFNAAALAKANGGTPFKRPENGVFRPGTRFRSFAFTETGDTDLATEAGSNGGGFGAVQMLDQRSPSADTGKLRLLFQGDAVHAAFDNISWLTDRTVAVVEDRGDTFHSQGNGVQPTALDSAWAIDANVDHSKTDAGVLRFLAEGRDASATIDSALLGTPGFTNDGDNEITGIHTSDGDPTIPGLLGAREPQPFASRDDDRHGRGRGDDRGLPWRVFFTQQHGDNHLWELVSRP